MVTDYYAQISVAALAVTGRSYIGILTLPRGRHLQAHKKLTNLYRRWTEAERLLEPSIGLLPHLLIIPVLLFVVGLLDNIISSAIPISTATAPIFIAGLIASASTISVAAYTIWTVQHGCQHPDTSPFQSTISQLIMANVPHALAQGTKVYHICYTKIKSWFYPHSLSLPISARASSESLSAPVFPPPILKDNGADDELSAYSGMTIYDHEAFQGTLLQVHEDEVLDQAAAAYFSILEKHRSEYIVGERPYAQGRSEKDYHENFRKVLAHMLSAEASLRTNITAAIIIKKCISVSPPHWSSGEDDIHLLQLLVESAKRYSLATVGEEISPAVLWTSPFSVAMLLLVDATKSEYSRRYNCFKVAPVAPIFCLLCMEKVAHDPALKFIEEFVTQLVERKYRIELYPGRFDRSPVKVYEDSNVGPDTEGFVEMISVLYSDPWFWLTLSRIFEHGTVQSNRITKLLNAWIHWDFNNKDTRINALRSVLRGLSVMHHLLGGDKPELKLVHKLNGDEKTYSFNKGPLLAFDCLLEGLPDLVGEPKDFDYSALGHSSFALLPSVKDDGSWLLAVSIDLITTLNDLDRAIQSTYRSPANVHYTGYKKPWILHIECARDSESAVPSRSCSCLCHYQSAIQGLIRFLASQGLYTVSKEAWYTVCKTLLNTTVDYHSSAKGPIEVNDKQPSQKSKGQSRTRSTSAHHRVRVKKKIFRSIRTLPRELSKSIECHYRRHPSDGPPCRKRSRSLEGIRRHRIRETTVRGRRE